MVKRFFQWCRTWVNRGLMWLEQQLVNQTRPSSVVTVVGALEDTLRSRDELIAENALLRQQLVILKRSVKRVQASNTDRRLMVWLASRLKGWREALLVVQPATLLMWHRSLFRAFLRRKSQRALGRPGLAQGKVGAL